MRYGGRTDVRTHNKIVPPYMLVWGSLRLAPITLANELQPHHISFTCIGSKVLLVEG